MRRSICLVEPSFALAGEVGTWRFCHTTAVPLPKGTRVKFDLQLKGAPIDWQIPSTDLKSQKNMIWAQIGQGRPLQAVKVVDGQPLSPSFEFTLPSELRIGETLFIFLGTPDHAKRADHGSMAQTIAQRRKPFHLYIDPKGKGDYKEPELFSIDVRGNVLHEIRMIVPSIVAKNKRFDLLVRFEDRFGNLTNQAPQGTLIELSYDQLRENLTWKLFVPETGFLVLPNLYFNEAGIYRIQLLNSLNKERFFSNPIRCFSEFDKNLYWGMLHGESEKIDAQEQIELCLKHFRDEKSLQFFASSPFENIDETSNEIWKLIVQQITEFNEEGRFTTFLGMQWFSEEDGLRHLIYAKEGKPLLRKKEGKSSDLKRIYKSHTPKELLSIPCFTMAKSALGNFSDFSPEFERVVEIYNAWGSSECTSDEGNLCPFETEDGRSFESEKGSIRRSLNMNHRFGFVAGGYDDRGIYAGCFEALSKQYTPGLTAILAIEQTREALFIALQNRSCYATTGARIVLGFFIAGLPMGSELNTRSKPGLALNRHITAYISATVPIQEIALIRNGEVIHHLNPAALNYEFSYDDSEHIEKISLKSPDERPPFIYYYIRVLQQDGHIAWSSPIWVDSLDTKAPLPKKIKK